MSCAVGDLFAEVVALAEDFAADVDDVLGVGVVFAEDEGLRDEIAPGEELRERVAEGLQDGANLVLHHNGAIELFRGVWKVVVQFFPAKPSCLLVATIGCRSSDGIRRR